MKTIIFFLVSANAFATSLSDDALLLNCWGVPTEDISIVDVISEAEDGIADTMIVYARPGGEATQYSIAPAYVNEDPLALPTLGNTKRWLQKTGEGWRLFSETKGVKTSEEVSCE